MEEDTTCKHLPTLLSSFVDTFVDFCVTDGIFLPPEPSPPHFQTSLPSPHRLIAIGDLHGDLNKSKQSLRLAGLIDSNDHWSGGSSTLVQVGDVLDRGGQEIKILYFLEKLKRQALKSGGNVITMNGNHEIMNVDGDFRYVTPSGLDEFKNWAYWFSVGDSIKSLCDGLEKPRNIYDGIPLTFPRVKQEHVEGFRSRIAALRPQGPIAARFLSKNLTVLVVGDSVFVHGGILPAHVGYGFERINEEVRDWISGLKQRVTSSLVRGRNSLVWLRIFSNEAIKDCDCSTLEHVLSTIPGARRMIMGHTIQEGGINGICDNRAIRIDVGMSKGCINGLPEVLEITDNSELHLLQGIYCLSLHISTCYNSLKPDKAPYLPPCLYIQESFECCNYAKNCQVIEGTVYMNFALGNTGHMINVLVMLNIKPFILGFHLCSNPLMLL